MNKEALVAELKTLGIIVDNKFNPSEKELLIYEQLVSKLQNKKDVVMNHVPLAPVNTPKLEKIKSL